jgi:hypothetical protein
VKWSHGSGGSDGSDGRRCGTLEGESRARQARIRVQLVENGDIRIVYVLAALVVAYLLFAGSLVAQ